MYRENVPNFKIYILFSWEYGTIHTTEVDEIQLNIANIFCNL